MDRVPHPRALAAAAVGRQRLAAVLGARHLHRVGSARASAAACARGACNRSEGRPRRLRSGRGRGRGARLRALRHQLAGASGVARNANHETSWALPHRLQQAGAPRWLSSRCSGLAFALAYAWLVREAWRGRARLGLRRAPSCSRLRTSSSGTSCGPCRSLAAEDDEPAALPLARALRVPAAPDDPALTLRRQDALEDEHAVLLEDDAPRGIAPQPHDLRDRGQRRDRSAYPGCVSSTATHFASSMNGKLRNRRRADRCAPSEFVALTTAFGGISFSARAAMRSCSVTTASRARASRRPEARATTGSRRAGSSRSSAAARTIPATGNRQRMRTRAAAKTAAATRGGVIAAV